MHRTHFSDAAVNLKSVEDFAPNKNKKTLHRTTKIYFRRIGDRIYLENEGLNRALLLDINQINCKLGMDNLSFSAICRYSFMS